MQTTRTRGNYNNPVHALRVKARAHLEVLSFAPKQVLSIKMPLYELNLILKPLPKKDIVACLKRVAGLIWQEDGVIRKIDYLGNGKLAFTVRGKDEGESYEEGSHFIYHTSLNSKVLNDIRPELKLDLDVIAQKFIRANQSIIPDDYYCTLDEELQPPAFRKSIQPILNYKNVITSIRR